MYMQEIQLIQTSQIDWCNEKSLKPTVTYVWKDLYQSSKIYVINASHLKTKTWKYTRPAGTK